MSAVTRCLRWNRESSEFPVWSESRYMNSAAVSSSPILSQSCLNLRSRCGRAPKKRKISSITETGVGLSSSESSDTSSTESPCLSFAIAALTWPKIGEGVGWGGGVRSIERDPLQREEREEGEKGASSSQSPTT
eukprot:scaffold136219_cov33-Tisochrysis_lutea.AAC.3